MERIGIFFVWKSNRTRLRLIIDARRSNCWFRVPPGVRSCTSGAFANVEIGDGVLAGLEGIRLHLGMADAKDCFHRLEAPAWLRPYFAWPRCPRGCWGCAGCAECSSSPPTQRGPPPPPCGR
eukprot:7423212-Pyramimonas_sp.AAC.1